MKRRGVGAAVALSVLLAALAGCATDGSELSRSTDTLRQESITLDDGRTVQCVIYSAGYKGGLSCDWDSAR